MKTRIQYRKQTKDLLITQTGNKHEWTRDVYINDKCLEVLEKFLEGLEK